MNNSSYPSTSSLPHKVKMQYYMCNSDYIQTTFFSCWRFIKKLAENQCSSITKGNIYHIKHIHTTFTMVVDWPEIECSMEVFTMFDICTYFLFALYCTTYCKLLLADYLIDSLLLGYYLVMVMIHSPWQPVSYFLAPHHYKKVINE